MLAAWSPAYVLEDAERWFGRKHVRWSLCAFVGISLIIMVPVLIATSLGRVGNTEVALAYDNVAKKLKSEVLTEGLHQKPVFGKMIKWPTTYQTVNNNDLECNTLDGVVLTCDINFQYAIQVQYAHNLTLAYKSVSNYEEIIIWRSRSAVRHACAKYTAKQFQTMRSEVSVSMNEHVASYLSDMKATVVEVQLVNVARPAAFETAVQEKEAAVADIDLARNEKQQQLTIANTNLLVASQEANRTLNDAQTQSSVVITKAQAEAASITAKFDTYARVYGNIMRQQNFTVEGILAYMGTRLVSNLDSMNMRLEAPAQLSWRDKL